MTLERGLRDLRLKLARLPRVRVRVADEPSVRLRDIWPGDPAHGAALLKGELSLSGSVRPLAPGAWPGPQVHPELRAATHAFFWLRDLRSIGTEAARLRARALVTDWIEGAGGDPLAYRPDVAGARIAAWLGHFDFFAASAEDGFRQALMRRLATDARVLAASLPAEQIDVRGLAALKGLFAASIASPAEAPYLTRALRLLPGEISRQVLADGMQAERSPIAHFHALRELLEIRAALQAGGLAIPPVLPAAIERMAAVLRMLRHGDGGLPLFNGTRGVPSYAIEQVLTQAGRTAGRAAQALPEGGFHRLHAGRTVMLVDAGRPPARGLDRLAHAGTLAFELSVGRDRLIVNCGAAPPGDAAWSDAARATAAHSTLTIADTSSSEILAEGLGRRPREVSALREEASGAHWLEASHDGWQKPFGALHRRRLYVAESGEDVRGEDSVDAASPVPFTVRFHLHPAVKANVQGEGESVLLRVAGGFWRFRSEGARAALEESIYLGGAETRRSEQIVLDVPADGPQHIKWALSRLG